jgi:multidrug efflux pump subunit AcrA (membrane-fusion protein)
MLGVLTMYFLGTPLCGPCLAQDKGGAGRLPVKVLEVREGDFSSTVSGMGTINYLAKAEVSSEIDGILADVKVDEGDVVKQGQIVAVIESSQLESQLAQARADVEVAEIDVSKTENELKKAVSKLKAARVGMEKSLAIFERYKKLAILGIASQTEMDKAEIAYEKSVSDYQIASEDYAALQTKSKQGHIEQEAKLLKARADAEMIRRRLEKCTIKAPIAGIVASKKKWPGENIEPRDSVIVTILQTKKVFAEVDVNENNAGSIKVGQQAEVKADAFPDLTFRGQVKIISPVIDINSRTLRVKVEVTNDRQLLKVGMFVRVKIFLDMLNHVITVPEEAIMTSSDGRRRVFVVVEGVAFLRDVETGLKRDGWVVVKKGVKAGERIVVEGQEKLKDLAGVQPIETTRP